MGCYGRENAYFESGDKRFRNCVWIELIGFDNTAEDYGVGRFLDAAGFVAARGVLSSVQHRLCEHPSGHGAGTSASAVLLLLRRAHAQ